MKRPIAALLVTMVIFALAAGPVLAAPPVAWNDTVDQEMPLTTCDSFGINFHARGTSKVTLFFDDSGNLVRRREHVVAEVTFYNTSRGEEFGLTGHSAFSNEIWVTEGRILQTGQLFSVILPGLGTVTMEVGATLIQATPGGPVVLSAAGQHPWWLAEPMPELCALLE